MEANIRLCSTREELTHRNRRAISRVMLTRIRESSRPPYIPSLCSTLKSHRGWVGVLPLLAAMDVEFSLEQSALDRI